MASETEMLLQEAAQEITQLRNQNNLMRARLDVFDKMMMVLTAQVQHSNMGMTEDLVWKIEKHLNQLNGGQQSEQPQ